MKFDKKTIISTILTLFILILITILIKVSIDEWKKSKQEGLQYYGDETKTLEAPLPYKTIMENIKYPDPNDPIYDIGNETYNNLLFNKNDKSMHFSDEQIMKDMKHFNNASNILLEHYLNNNVPDEVTKQLQDYDSDVGFISEDISISGPDYLNNNPKNIHRTMTYLYRPSEDKNQIKVKDGICLDASERNQNGGKVHMWNCDANNKNQQWSYNPSTMQIKVTDGLCLDASERERNEAVTLTNAIRQITTLSKTREKVHMWNCDVNNKNQQWNYDPSTMQIKSKDGICLDASERNKNGGNVHMYNCDVNNQNQQWLITGDPSANNGLYLSSDVTEVDGELEEDNIYNYDYTYNISGTALNYTDVYDQLTKYNESSFNTIVSMTKPGKYSSHYFESNYGDISGNVTKDFKHFYSAAHTLAGHGLFNKR